MDKNKTLVDKKQYHIDKIYDAIRGNETVCDLFCECIVRLEGSGIIAESFYADIINNKMKGEVGRILKQQKCFGYTEQDSLILYLFCTRLRGFHCLESNNDADGNCRGIVGMINQMELEQKIMLIYRLLCENLKAIRFYPLSENVGIEVKNEHVVRDSVIDQFIRIKNEASKLKTIGRYRNKVDDKLELLDVTVESKESNSQNIGIMEFIKSKLPANFDNKVEVCFKFGDDAKEKDKKENINFNVSVWYDKKSSEMRFISNNFAATKSEFDFVENKLLEKKYFDYQKGNEFILNLFTCYLKKSLEAEQPDCFIDLTGIQDDKIQEIYNKFVANVSGIWFNPKPSLLSKQGIESVEKMLPELDQIAIDCKKFDEKSYAKFIDWNSSDTLKEGLRKERMKKIKSGKVPLNKITYLESYDYYDYYFTRVTNNNVLPTILDDTLIEPNELFDVINKNKTSAFHTKIKNLLGPYELFSAQQCIELINEGLIKLNFGSVGSRSSISFDKEQDNIKNKPAKDKKDKKGKNSKVEQNDKEQDSTKRDDKKQDELAHDLFELIKIIFFEVRVIFDIREHLCSCESKDKRQLAQAIINHLPNMVDDNEEDKDKKIEIINQIIKEQKYRDEFFKLVGADTVINIDDFFQGVEKNNGKVSVDNFVQFVKDNKLVITQDNFSFFMSWLKDNICVDSSDNLKKLMDCVVSRLKDKEFGSAERINLIEFVNYLCEDQNLNKDGDKLADCYYKLVEDIIKSNRFKNDDNGKCTIYPSNAVKILDYMFIMQSKFKNNPIKIVEIVNALTAQPVWDCFQFGSFIRETFKVFKKYDFRSIYQENTKNKLSDKEICDTLNKSTSSPIYTDSKRYEFEIKIDMDSDGHLFLPLLLQHGDQGQRQDFCLKLGNQKYADDFLKSLKGDALCFDNVLSMKSFDALVLRFKEFVINHPDVKELPDPEGHADNREMLFRSELLKPKFSVGSLSKIFENIFSKESNAVSLDKLDQFTDWLVYVIDNYSDLVYKADEYRDNNVQLYDDLIKKCFHDDFKLSVDQSISFVKKFADALSSRCAESIVDGSFVIDFVVDRCLAEGEKFTPTEVVALTGKLIDQLNTENNGLIGIDRIEDIIIKHTNFDAKLLPDTEIKNIFLVLAKQHENGKKIDGNAYDLLKFILCNKFCRSGTRGSKLFDYYSGRSNLIKEDIKTIVGAFNTNKIFKVNKKKYCGNKFERVNFSVSGTGQITKVIFKYEDENNHECVAEVDIKDEVEKENSNNNESKLITKVSNLDDKLENNLNPTGEKNNDNNEKSRDLSSKQKENTKLSSNGEATNNLNITMTNLENENSLVNNKKQVQNENKQKENLKLHVGEQNTNLEVNIGEKNQNTNPENSNQSSDVKVDIKDEVEKENSNNNESKLITKVSNLDDRLENNLNPTGEKNNDNNEKSRDLSGKQGEATNNLNITMTNNENKQKENLKLHVGEQNTNLEVNTGEKNQNTDPENSNQSSDVKKNPQVIQENNSFFTWDTNFCIGVMLGLSALAFIKFWILFFIILPFGYMIYKGCKCKQFNNQKELAKYNSQVVDPVEQKNESVDQNLSEPVQIGNQDGKEKDNNNENDPLIE